MFKKWFSRKKDNEDDDDFDDDDFDEEDFGEEDFGDSDSGEMMSEQGGDGESDLPEQGNEESPVESMEQSIESDRQGMPDSIDETEAAEDVSKPSGDPDHDGMPGEVGDDELGPDDFDDEDFDGEFDDDDEEDGDEEEGRFAALFENKWIRLSVIGLAVLFVVIGVGFGGWWFIAGSSEEEMADQNLPTVSSGGGLQPSSSLDTEEGQVPSAGQLLPPPTVSNEGVSGEQLSAGGATSGFGATGGLNAIGTGGGGLNTLSGGAQSTAGSGVVIPMTTASSFSQFPDYPTNDALPKAPIPELLQFRDGELPLPKISPSGQVSWQEYARPSNVPSNKKRVALLISGLGLSRAATLSAISKLPAAVSLSFSPYAEELEQWMIRSRREGHEVLLGMPLESNRFPIEDPGPLALMVNLSEEESQRRLDTVLSSQQGYIGVEVSMGSKYTADEFSVRQLLAQLNARGLMVVDGAWNNRSLIPRLAAEISMPHVISSVRLDEVLAKAAVDAKLKELDAVIELRGSGVGSTAITPAILERLLAWISSLPGKNIELVPVSALIGTGPGS